MHTIQIILVILAIWAIPWKVYAVWLSAKHDQKIWFVVLLLINTVSILELIYIFKILKKPWVEVKSDFAAGWSFFKQKIGVKGKENQI